MAKRYRQFRRIKFTAKIGALIRESLVDKTLKDHFSKCWNHGVEDIECYHSIEGNLGVARLVEAGITVGKKRGYLDVRCPYSLSKPWRQVFLLENTVGRLRRVAEASTTKRKKDCLLAVAQEIDDYAHRNAMEVLAEQVVDVDFSSLP